MNEVDIQSFQAKGGYAASSVGDIVSYEQRDHIYNIPDTYIGSIQPNERVSWLFSPTTNRMVQSVITVPLGQERLMLEILWNACDNVSRSRLAGFDPKCIEFFIDRSHIVVTNYGQPMPVELHPVYGEWGPTLNFSRLLTGTNFTDQRGTMGGRNGYGNKLTNIFSLRFDVVVEDSIRQRYFTQSWTNNMCEASSPQVIEGYACAESKVQVGFDLDFARFGIPLPEQGGGYSDEFIMLCMRHCIDASYTKKIPVIFNGQVFDVRSPRLNAQYYFGDVVKKAVLHYEWPRGVTFTKHSDGYCTANDGVTQPIVEMLVVDAENRGEGVVISFANSVATIRGGPHAEAAVRSFYDAVVTEFASVLGGPSRKKKTDKKSTKKPDKKEEVVNRAFKLNIKDFRPNISIIISVNLDSPQFDGQCKEALTAPARLSFALKKESLKPVDAWALLPRLRDVLSQKTRDQLAKTDGSMRGGRISSKKITDANFAGKSQSNLCILCGVEGDSAAGYVKKLITVSPTKRDYLGTLKFRGKVLNVKKATLRRVAECEEIINLKQALGLREGVDYTRPENFATLRYGAFMIMTDADDDGNHIKSLILLIFSQLYPTLLQMGYVMYWTTPKFLISKGKRVLARLNDDPDLEAWKQANPTWEKEDYSIQYMKGLGTSNDEDVQYDYDHPRMVTIFYDDQAENAMSVAFDNKRSNDRKTWIAQHVAQLGFEGFQFQRPDRLGIGNVATALHIQRPLSWFIYCDLVRYAIANLKRSIPRLEDCLKDVQRKIIAGMIKRFKLNNVTSYSGKVKTAQFAAYIAEQYDYHHGEGSISGAITNMAWEWVGSNNLPYFTREGQLGTRDENGKDAADARYTFVAPESLIPKIYRKEDELILTYLKEGKEVYEPEVYYPILPMFVNGVTGIATGDSSSVPNYDPLTISDWLKGRLLGWSPTELPVLRPWYRGFLGTNVVIDRTKKAALSRAQGPRVKGQQAEPITVDQLTAEQFNEIIASETEFVNIRDENGDKYDAEEQVEYYKKTNAKYSLVSIGNFHIDKDKVVITELPIGRSMQSYRERFLDRLVEEKKLKGYRDNSDAYRVHIELQGYTGKVSHSELRLIRTQGMSNMVFLNEKERPVHYENVYMILEDFFQIRLRKYDERKQKIIEQIEGEIHEMSEKLRFILAVFAGQIVLQRNNRGVPERELFGAMDALGFNHKLKHTETHHYTEEYVEKLRREIAKLIEKRDTLAATPAGNIWYNELNEFDAAYLAFYAESKQVKLYGSLPPRVPCGPGTSSLIPLEMSLPTISAPPLQQVPEVTTKGKRKTTTRRRKDTNITVIPLDLNSQLVPSFSFQ